MASSLSNLVKEIDLAEEIHKVKYNYGHDDKKCEICRIKCKDCYYLLEYTNIEYTNTI